MKKQLTLKEFIDKKKLSQKKAAFEIGISREYLNQLLNARLPAGRQVCVKLAKWSNGKINLAPLMVQGLGYLEKQIKDEFDPALSRKIDAATIAMEG